MQPEQQPVQPITPAAPPTSPQPFVGNMPMQQYTQVPQPHYTDIWGIMSIIFAFLFSPVGLILGIVGIVQAKKHQASKVLSIVGIVLSIILTIITFLILMTLMMSTKVGIATKARDTERQTDIKALHGQLEAYYYSKSGTYPTLANMNDNAFREANMKTLYADALQDPNWGTSSLCVVDGRPALADQLSADCYAYVVSPAGCDNIKVNCTSYILSASLEDTTGGQEIYTKTSLGSL